MYNIFFQQLDNMLLSQSRLVWAGGTIRVPLSALRPSSIARLTPQLHLSTARAGPQAKTARGIENYVRGVKKKWGDSLPERLLSPEEMRVYETYFGPPGRLIKQADIAEEDEHNARQTVFEHQPVERRRRVSAVKTNAVEGLMEEELTEEEAREIHSSKEPLTRAEAKASSTVGVQKAQEEEDPEHSPKEEESESEEEEEEEDNDLPDDAIRANHEQPTWLRVHPLSRIGRFATVPFTIFPSEPLTQLTVEMLSTVSNKHLDDLAQKLYGNPALHSSPIATEKKKNNTSSWPIHPSYPMSDIEADLHYAAVMPGLYAQALSALSELRRRLGRNWVLDDVRRILDVGTGGAGVVAWQSVVEAEEAANGAHVDTTPPGSDTPGSDSQGPDIKATVITASPALRNRSAKLLENTTFLPHLPDTNPTNTSPRVQTPPHPELQQQQPSRKYYDLIISTNILLPLREEYQRKLHIENLWSLLNPSGGVLLLIEKGTPLGFEAIAAARQHLLKYNISSPGSEHVPQSHPGYDGLEAKPKLKEPGHIIAPCTNHEECPMFPTGHVLQRKDFCRFPQRYIRPSYMQRLIGSPSRDHEDLHYSFVSFRRGIDYRQTPEAQNPINPTMDDFNTTTTPATSPYSEQQIRAHIYTLPRLILPSMKKKGHIIMDLCTNKGAIERWIVPKSHGKPEYRDAKKSRWGDLWALGAKTKIPRQLKVILLRLENSFLYR